ncbi:tyrosine-type recombinase/integrase [Arthrobacter sp. NPDC093128]|uniref:tyrosine-type recombinase/integrase n=1 Tax=Arthrobacter sp. NPDC093128 TaxID=3154979 RepID=UPI0034270698
MSQARDSNRSPLRAATYETLIGLLAAGGLRIAEAITLDRSDIDWSGSVLLIRESKFGKSRLVPTLHSTAMDALTRYADLRDELEPRPLEPSFFVSQTHKRLSYAVVGRTFRKLVDAAGVGPEHLRLRGSTICATLSRSAPCSAGTAPVRTCRQSSHGCRPTWATANRHPPTGTSWQHRN